MKLFSRNLFLILAVVVTPLSACSSDENISEIETSAQEQRLMTAPAVQQNIQRAQQANSLSELYADGEPPKVAVEKSEQTQIPQDNRTVEDIAEEIITDVNEELAEEKTTEN